MKQAISLNGEDQNSDLNDNEQKPKLEESVFIECKDLMRPVRKALKNIDVKGSNISEKDQVEKIKKHLLEIGDRINECLSRYSDPDRIKQWRNYLWIFVSKFTTWSAERLKTVYKKLSKSRDAKVNTTAVKSQDDRDSYKPIQNSNARSNIKNEIYSNNSNNTYSNKNIPDSWKKDKLNENNEYTQAGWYSSSDRTNKLGTSSRIQNNQQFIKEETIKFSKNNIKNETASNISFHGKNFAQNNFPKTSNINDLEDWGTHSHEKKYSSLGFLNNGHNDDKDAFDYYKMHRNKEQNKILPERNNNITHKGFSQTNWPFKELGGDLIRDIKKYGEKNSFDSSYTDITQKHSVNPVNSNTKWTNSTQSSSKNSIELSKSFSKNNTSQKNAYNQVSRLRTSDDIHDANIKSSTNKALTKDSVLYSSSSSSKLKNDIHLLNEFKK